MNARNCTILALALFVTATSTSCREIAAAFSSVNQGGGGAGNGDGAGNGPGNGSEPVGGDGVPVVRLTASNVSPQAGEEVILDCQLVSGSTDALAFSFDLRSNRLTVDSERGRATFVVDQTDIGVAQSFTCSGTNSNGGGQASNSVVVTATAPAEVP